MSKYLQCKMPFQDHVFRFILGIYSVIWGIPMSQLNMKGIIFIRCTILPFSTP